MGVYNIHYTGLMPPLALGKTIEIRENITSSVDIVNTKHLVYLARGRKTNYTRSFLVTPTVGDFDNPEFVNNKRVWTMTLTHMYSTTANPTGYDTQEYRLQGLFQAPVMETYDIELYYGDSKTLVLSALTKIEGINIVLNITVAKDYTYVATDSPISSFTEYTDNDVVDILPGSNGEPSSADEELDAQYGTQIWQV